MGFKHHSNHHNLNFRISKKRVNDEDTDYSSEFSESEEFEISEISKDLLAHHIPPSTLSLDNSSNPQKKKLKLTNSETVLASSDSLTADNQTKADKIMLAKLGCWVPLIYNRGNQQYGVLASPSSASLLLQDSQEPGIWESPIPDGETCSTSLVKTDGDSLIAHIKSTWYELLYCQATHNNLFFFLAKHLENFPLLAISNYLKNMSTYSIKTG